MQLDDRVIYPMAWYQGAGVCSLLAFLLPLIFTLQPSVWPSLLLLCLSPFSFLPWPFYHPLPLSPSYCNFLLAFHDQATKLVQFISRWVIKASLQNWLEDSKLWVNTTVDATFFFYLIDPCKITACIPKPPGNEPWQCPESLLCSWKAIR